MKEVQWTRKISKLLNKKFKNLSKILDKEIKAFKKLEKMIFDGRKKKRKHYNYLHRLLIAKN